MLTLISTPIGNLGDISERALKELKEADIILCEDTRVSKKLLSHFGIEEKHLISFHEHNEDFKQEKAIESLKNGQRVALISDAGTPLISDPGFKLVRACHENGIKVTAVPGASSPIVGLTLSGFPTDKFYFGGFLPVKSGGREKTFNGVKNLPATLIFFESPHRVLKTVDEMQKIFPNRKIALTRELTKKFEEVIIGTPSEVLETLKKKDTIKGEFVVLIEPGKDEISTLEDIIDLIKEEIKNGTSAKEIASNLSEAYKIPKKEIYNKVIEIKK